MSGNSGFFGSLHYWMRKAGVPPRLALTILIAAGLVVAVILLVAPVMKARGTSGVTAKTRLNVVDNQNNGSTTIHGNGNTNVQGNGNTTNSNNTTTINEGVAFETYNRTIENVEVTLRHFLAPKYRHGYYVVGVIENHPVPYTPPVPESYKVVADWKNMAIVPKEDNRVVFRFSFIEVIDLSSGEVISHSFNNAVNIDIELADGREIDVEDLGLTIEVIDAAHAIFAFGFK